MYLSCLDITDTTPLSNAVQDFIFSIEERIRVNIIVFQYLPFAEYFSIK